MRIKYLNLKDLKIALIQYDREKYNCNADFLSDSLSGFIKLFK